VTAPPASFFATRRGRLTLLLLSAVQFLDVADSSIMNVAVPSIRRDLGFSVQNLQWVLDLLRHRHRTHQRPARRPHPARGGAHQRIPARPTGLRDLSWPPLPSSRCAPPTRAASRPPIPLTSAPAWTAFPRRN